MKGWRYIGILWFIFLVQVTWAQDVEFSQFYSNRLYLNPAFAGAEFVPVVSLNYRNQWPQNNRPFVTYSFSYDQYIDFMKGGMGVQVIQDDQGQGAIKTTMLSWMYAYSLDINRELSIKAGLKASLIQRRLEWESLIFSDMIDPLYGVIYPSREVQPFDLSKTYWDFSTGLIASYRNYYLGLAVDHISEPDQSFQSEEDYTRLPRKYTLHAGASFPVGRNRGLLERNFTISPNLLFQQQQDFQQMNYGFYVTRYNWVLGGWFRQNLSFDYDAFIFLFGFSNEQFRIGYSYDYVVSDLLKTNSGAHEISVNILFGRKRTTCSGDHFYKRKRRIRAIRCPKF